MTITSDSGPLISFARADKLDLLQKLTRKVIISPAVYYEITVKGQGMVGADIIKKASWIKLIKPENKREVELLQNKLGSGESEAIILAEERRAPLLVDDRKATLEAKARGIEVISTISLLLRAKELGLIKSVKEELDKFITAGFRLSQRLYQEALQRAKES